MFRRAPPRSTTCITDGGTYYFGRTEERAWPRRSPGTTRPRATSSPTTWPPPVTRSTVTSPPPGCGWPECHPIRPAACPTAKSRPRRAEWGVNPAPGQSLREAAQPGDDRQLRMGKQPGALAAGVGNAQVRAGVLRALTTVSGITVRTGTAAGQPTLIVTEATNGSGCERWSRPGTRKILTLNARTGIPLEVHRPRRRSPAGYQRHLPGLPGHAGRHRGRPVLIVRSA